MDVVLVDPALRFERLVMAHQREVWRYLRFLGATPSEADDLTQETFLEVWRRPFIEYNDRATAAYLRRVARNRLLMRLRKQSREPQLSDDVEVLEATWTAFAGEDAGDARMGALEDCLETLKAPGRGALEQLYAERRSRSEVAEALELTVEGLKTLVRRCKVKLRECVERRLRREERVE